MKIKQAIAMLILLLAATDFVMPVAAIEVTSGDVLNKVDGKYGANLANVTGATVNTDFTTATITNTQKNSVLNWNSLNTARTQTLNYVMSDGQTSLNNVIGIGLSSFAGALKAEKGRVIISNPNGIIFEKGSFVNTNALTLTTHKVIMNNDDVYLLGSDNNASIKIEGGDYATSRPVLFIAKDLNIVSNNIDMNSSDIVAKDVRLITSDGVTFYDVSNTKTSSAFNALIDNNNYTNNGNINIADSTFAVRDNSTGKISIISRGDINVKNTKLDGDVVADASKRNIIKNKSEVINSVTNTFEETAVDDANLSNWQDFWNKVSCFFTGSVPKSVLSGKVYKTTDTKITNSTLKYDELSGRGNVNFNNVTVNGKTDVKAHKIAVNNSALNGATTILSEAIKVTSYEKNNTTTEITTKTADKFIVDDKFFGVAKDGHFNLEEVTPEVTTSTLTVNIAQETKNLDSLVSINGLTSNDTVKASGDSIEMKNSIVNNVNLIANVSDINLDNVKATGNLSSDLKAKNNINVKAGQFKTIRAAAADIKFTDTNVNNANIKATNNVELNRTDSRKTYSVNDSTIIAGNSINTNNAKINNSNLTASKNLNANNSNISNSTINVGRNVYSTNSVIDNSNLYATNDIIVSGSSISDSVMNAIKDVKMQNATLNNTTVSGRYGFLNNAILENNTKVAVNITTGNTYETNGVIENLIIKNSTLKSNTNNINLKNTKLDNATIETTVGKDLNIDTTSDVKLTGIDIGGNLNITQAGDVTITNSQTTGGKYIPELAEGKEHLTDYDRTKFTLDYFNNLIQENGTDYGRNLKLSEVKGNINIGNANNSLIINTIVGGNLDVSNIAGEANLITSLVEGNYSPVRETISNTNVYNSYINGKFDSAFDFQLIANNSTPTNSIENPNRIEDVNRNRYGNDVNTVFSKTFAPRGFAAQEDELTAMKSQVKSIKKGNKIQITNDFHAY